MKALLSTIAASLAALSLVLTACAKDRNEAPALAPDRSPHASAMTGHDQIVELSVTEAGFVPASFTVRAGHPVKLIVTRKVERTCATDIILKELKIAAPLPLDKAVELTFTPTQPGKIKFACAMNHITGEIVVE